MGVGRTSQQVESAKKIEVDLLQPQRQKRLPLIKKEGSKEKIIKKNCKSLKEF